MVEIENGLGAAQAGGRAKRSPRPVANGGAKAAKPASAGSASPKAQPSTDPSAKGQSAKPPASKPLSQNPHRTSEPREKNLEVAIGRSVRAFRRQKAMTVADLSRQTGLSIGMLSKIENGITSPSLATLQSLAHSLSVPITAFFRRYEERREVMHVKAGAAIEMDRAGTRAGHQYHLLGHIGANASGVIVEPYLIELNETSDVFPTFQHDGIELLYFLEGEVEYRHGDQAFHMRPGDSLFFDADAPHGPEKLLKLPARFLSVIAYPQAD